MKSVLLFIVLLAFVSTSLIGCQSMTGRTAGQSIDDTTITAEIKGKLVKEEKLGAAKIDVDSFQGNVTLAGQVPDKEAEQRALQIARETGGVKSVKSNMLVGSQTTPAGEEDRIERESRNPVTTS